MKTAVAAGALLALISVVCIAQDQPPAAQPPEAAPVPAQEIAPPLPAAASSQQSDIAAPLAASEDRAPAAKIWDGTKELGSKTGAFFADAAKKSGSFFGNAGQKTGSFFKGLFVKE